MRRSVVVSLGLLGVLSAGACATPQPGTLQGATAGNVRGSLIVDPSLRRATFIATTGRLPT